MALSLGQVNFGLGADTQGLRKAVNRLNEFSREVDKAAKAAEGANNAMISSYARQESAVRGALQQVLRLNQQIRQAGAPPELIARNTKAFQSLTKAMTSGQLNALEFNRSMDRFSGQLGKSRRGLNDFKKPLGEASDRTRNFSKWMRDLESASVLAVGPLSGLGARIQALGSITARGSLAIAGFLGAITAVTVGVGLLLKEAIRTERVMAQITNSLRAATGSAALANREFEFLTETATSLGLSLEATASSYARLLASARPTTSTMAEVRQAFVGLSQAATVFDLTAQETEGAMRALEDIVGKGVVSMEELRRQLATKLPGVLGIVAEELGNMGVLTRGTTAELNKMVASGKLASDVFLRALGPALQRVFSEDAARAAGDIESSINNLSNAVFLLAREFDRAAGVSKLFQDTLDTTTAALNGLRANLDVILGLIGALAGAAIATAIVRMQAMTTAVNFLSASFANLSLQGIIAGFTALAGSIRSATAASMGFLASIRTIQRTTIIGFLARLGVIIGTTIVGYKLFASAVSDTADAQGELIEETKNFLKVFTQLDQQSAKTAQGLSDLLQSRINELQVDLVQAKQRVDQLRQSLENSANTTRFFATQIGNTQKLKKAQEQFDKLNAEQNQLIALLQQLQRLLRDFDAGITDVSEAAQSALDNIAELGVELEILRKAQEAFAQGPDAVQRILDLGEAQKRLAGVGDEEMILIKERLEELGFTAENVEEAYADLIATQRNLNEVVSEFLKRAREAPATMRGLQQETDALRRKLDALRAGPEALEQFEQTEQINSAMQQFNKELEKLEGIVSASRLNEMRREHRRLLEQIIPLERQLKDAASPEERADALAEANRQIERLRGSTEAMAQGPEAFKQFEQLQEHNDQLREFREALKSAGVEGAQLSLLMDQFTEALKRNEAERERFAEFQRIVQGIESTVDSAFDNITQAITEAFVQGEADAVEWRNVMLAIINEIISGLLRTLIISRLVNSAAGAISGVFAPSAAPAPAGGGGAVGGGAGFAVAANGLAFNQGKVTAFARGGIVDKPIMFPFSNGVGIAGEAGTEAILPLTRKRGKLGVEASGLNGGGESNEVIINIIDQRSGDAPAIEQRSRRTADGRRQIDVVVRDSFRRQFREGAFTRDFEEVLGLRRKSSR